MLPTAGGRSPDSCKHFPAFSAARPRPAGNTDSNQESYVSARLPTRTLLSMHVRLCERIRVCVCACMYIDKRTNAIFSDPECIHEPRPTRHHVTGHRAPGDCAKPVCARACMSVREHVRLSVRPCVSICFLLVSASTRAHALAREPGKRTSSGRVKLKASFSSFFCTYCKAALSLCG